jgi:hypothetical protein
MQKAMQWWSEKLTTRLWCESEQIREELLQDMFAIRRSLELSLVNNRDISIAMSQDWLERFDQLHQSLGLLRNVLSPAYIEESLPLAIQSMLNQWDYSFSQREGVALIADNLAHECLRSSSPNRLTVATELPVDWLPEPLGRSRVILTTVSELLKIAVPEAESGIHLVIRLRQQKQLGELMIAANYFDTFPRLSRAHRQELRYLQQSFQCLTSGTCSYQKRKSTMTWYLRWQLLSENRKE